jgi:hypothetical protein
MLYWALLGLVIGVAAAQRKGWNLLAGAVGGALLGPLALLLFFVSGVTRGDQKKKCPHCAEWVQAAAKVCKHCGREAVALAFALLCGALLACSPDPPRIEEAVVAEPTAAPASAPRDDAAAAELARAQHRILQLENQLREQQGQIDEAYDNAQRYQQGLERCVAKLNTVAADADALASYVPAPVVAAPSRGGSARVHTLSAPQISMVGDSAVVSVRIWNAGDGSGSGAVELELVCAGAVVDSSTEYVDISARTDQVVNATLRTGGSDGPCSGRAHLRF